MTNPYPYTTNQPVQIKTFIIGALSFSIALSLNDAVKNSLDGGFNKATGKMSPNNILAHWMYVIIILVFSLIVIYCVEKTTKVVDTISKTPQNALPLFSANNGKNNNMLII